MAKMYVSVHVFVKVSAQHAQHAQPVHVCQDRYEQQCQICDSPHVQMPGTQGWHD